MHLLVRPFPEIVIKSPPVRKKLIRQLQHNIEAILDTAANGVAVRRDWEKIELELPNHPERVDRAVDELQRVPGIDAVYESICHDFQDFPDLVQFVTEAASGRIDGHSFCVRARRHGQHDFSSTEVEREVGARLLQLSDSARVDLTRPEVTVRVDIKHGRVHLLGRRWEGLGGYPLGSQDEVLSLLSGGFDSSVASYATMRRGLKTHFLFFNLGGRAHEIGVREMAFHLWQRYGRSHPVKFVSVPFDRVLAAIARCGDDSYATVLLKRMMLRTASRIAQKLGVSALVTGESVAQVSSQTLPNLAAIDPAAGVLVLRPLVTTDKRDIIRIAREIGTEAMAAAMPEFCGAFPGSPTTRARPGRVAALESELDEGLVDDALERMLVLPIGNLAEDLESIPVDIVENPLPGSVVIDVRHPQERDAEPLTDVPLAIPYYELQRQFGSLDAHKTYLLYCRQGVMSRLHAEMLIEAGHRNVGVYRPANATESTADESA